MVGRLDFKKRIIFKIFYLYFVVMKVLVMVAFMSYRPSCYHQVIELYKYSENKIRLKEKLKQQETKSSIKHYERGKLASERRAERRFTNYFI